MKKALITGINGFVGPYLKKILMENDYDVFGIDRNGENLDYQIFQADLLDKNKIRELIAKIKPESVFHLAGQSSVKKSFEIPEKTFEINVLGTKNIYDALQKENLDCKMILISSCQVYGNPQKVPIDEKCPLSSLSPYADSRIKQEELALSYKKINSVILRSFNHIGPNQPEDFVISAFAKQIIEIKNKRRETQIFTGNLAIVRDFTDVRDIVRAYLLADQKITSSDIFNVGSQKGYVLRDLLKKMLKIADIKAEIIEKTDLIRKDDIQSLICDRNKFSSQTGWNPQISIEESLESILNYWQNKVTLNSTK